MTDFLKRLRVHWHAVAVTLIGTLPVLLDQLQYIDLKPILSHFVGDDWAGLLIGLLPLYIAFLRPMIHVAESEEKKE